MVVHTGFLNQKTQIFFTVKPVVRNSKGGFDVGCYFYRFLYHSLIHLDLLVCFYVGNGSQNTFEHVNYCNYCKTWQVIWPSRRRHRGSIMQEAQQFSRIDMACPVAIRKQNAHLSAFHTSKSSFDGWIFPSGIWTAEACRCLLNDATQVCGAIFKLWRTFVCGEVVKTHKRMPTSGANMG